MRAACVKAGTCTDGVHVEAADEGHLDAVQHRDPKGKERMPRADEEALVQPARQRAPVTRQRVHVEAATHACATHHGLFAGVWRAGEPAA